MAVITPHWIFINEKNRDEKIIVHDLASAQALMTILKTQPTRWLMKEVTGQEAKAAVQPSRANAVLPPIPTQISMHVEPPVEERGAASASASEEMEAPLTIELDMPAPAAKVAPPPAPKVQSKAAPKTEAKTEVKAEAKTEAKSDTKADLKVQPRGSDRRTQQRFNVDLRIILISRGKSFRNISKDVSLGGIKLKSRVPAEFVGQQCVAYISNTEANENIEVVCQVISDPKDPSRIQFVDANSEQLKRLKVWLVDKASLEKAS